MQREDHLKQVMGADMYNKLLSSRPGPTAEVSEAEEMALTARKEQENKHIPFNQASPSIALQQIKWKE